MIVKRFVFAGALVALSLSFGPAAFAQDMGGDDKQDEGSKPDADKPDAPKPDAPKPDAPKADEPKPDAKPEAPKTKKSLVFDEAPSSWKLEPKARGAVLKHLWQIEGVEGSDGAQVAILFVGKSDLDKELDRWIKDAEGADGKKIEKSAAKQESLESNGVKIKTVELTGKMPEAFPKKRKRDEAPEKKANQKLVAGYLEGPDGAWVVRLQGGEKTVDKARDDFMKLVKSAKVGDRPVEERKPRKKKGEE